MEKSYCTAIVLAAGQGKRMNSAVRKQYLMLAGKPILYYSLYMFQSSDIIDEIVLVVGAGETDYCREQFVDKYGFTKVSKIVTGGAERYHSVWNGLKETREKGYVFIHDGARPFVDEAMIARAYEEVKANRACVVGMPVKDTIKLADENGFVADTPPRSRLWTVQTPQVFETALVRKAYAKLMQKESQPDMQLAPSSSDTPPKVTDDAMVVESMLGFPVKLVEGSYENMKITTPEDLKIGEVFCQSGGRN